MMRLRARLERLRRLRRQEFEHQRRELEQACAICGSAREARASSEAEAEAIALQNRRSLAAGSAGIDVRSRNAASAASQEAARSGRRHHAHTTERVAEAQGRLALASRRLRGLEILQARRQRAEAVQAERRSQRELDEIGRRGWQDRER